MSGHKASTSNAQFAYRRPPGSYQYSSPHICYQSGIDPHRSSFATNVDAATPISHHSWADSPPARDNVPIGINNDTPCENCDYQHRCIRSAGSLFCHRCVSLNSICKTAIKRPSISPPLASRDCPRDPIHKLTTGYGTSHGFPTSANRYGNPPIVKTASATSSLPRSSKVRGNLERSVERGTGRGCIPALDARLSRLENLLGEALPNASQVLGPGKYAAGLAINNFSSSNHESTLYPSQLTSAGTSARRVSQDSPLKLPEDPLLDGAVEDALLAGQPVHQLHSCGISTSLTKKGKISTTRLFLEPRNK